MQRLHLLYAVQVSKLLEKNRLEACTLKVEPNVGLQSCLDLTELRRDF